MIDLGSTKAKFPGLASGKPRTTAPGAGESSMADDDAGVEGDDEGAESTALSKAESALEMALAAVREAMKK